MFRGSAWEWSEARQQFYYHAFTKEQPDLNYWNPAIIQEMKDVLTFWMDKGVDGFRMDAVPWLFEDPEFKDEPLSGWSNDPEDYLYLYHIYTFHYPDVIQGFSNQYKSYDKCLGSWGYCEGCSQGVH